MSNYQLKVFEPIGKNDWTRRYRLQLLIQITSKVTQQISCAYYLERIFESGKPVTEFGKMFGEKSFELAIELLEEALRQEEDEKVKSELEKRLKNLAITKKKNINS